MNKVLISLTFLLAGIGMANAASIANGDAENLVLVVTEDGSKREVVIEPGAKVVICPKGCFITLPSGDLEALTGKEEVEILNGSATIK